MAQIVRLKLLGNIYELKGDDPDVDLQEVVAYIEGKAKKIEAEHPGLPPARLMVLIVMSLGRDMIMERNRYNLLADDLQKQGIKLMEKINSVLGEKF